MSPFALDPSKNNTSLLPIDDQPGALIEYQYGPLGIRRQKLLVGGVGVRIQLIDIEDNSCFYWKKGFLGGYGRFGPCNHDR